MVPRLSNELIARIIHYLRDDALSLKNCSLTCHSFLPRSHYNLFHTVSLHLRNSRSFYKLLEENVEIGVCVKELHVSVSTLEQAPTWVDKLLPSMSPKLPNVVELHLKGKGPYTAIPFRGLKSVQHIRILGCEIESLNEFCALMGSFPYLEVIYTNEMFVYRSKEIIVKSTAPSSRFNRIEFNSCSADPDMIADWMIQESFHINLQALAVCPLQQVGLPPIAKLLKACGPSMKHVKIALVGLVAQGGFVGAFVPSFFPNRSALNFNTEILEKDRTLVFSTELRVLEFGSPAAYSALYGADDKSFDWFPTLLAQVCSPYIETIAFYLWENDLEGLSSPVWDDIARLLSSKQFMSLKNIVFHVWGNQDKASAIIQAVKVRFTTFDKSGVLQIDDVPDPVC